MTSDNQLIKTVLSRGVVEILPSKSGLASLMKKRKITLYQGFDPSTPFLHLGHWIGIRKLAQFQKLGHKVIFLIGDFTGMIGDPTDKVSVRKKLTRRQVLKNAKDYQKIASKALKFEGTNAAQVLFNSQWLAKLSLAELIELASHFTVQQMLERDFFQERIKAEKPIFLHEFLYPLMQGYDSVVMNVDLEIGGSDQLFNMLAGRSLMKALKKREKYILTMKLLTDPEGQKMGKSAGNAVNLTSPPVEMFGQIMALPDSFLEAGFELLTDRPPDLAKKHEPLEAKKILAEDIVSQLYDKESAQKARKEFERRHQKRIGAQKPRLVFWSQKEAVLDKIVAWVKKTSRSEAKRLINRGAVDINGQTITNPKHKLSLPSDLKIGKATFVRIKKQ